MPRPNPPPTPGSSSDIRGKDSTAVNVAPAFNLPPAAFAETDRASTSSSTPSANGSDSSYRPASPTSPADLSRKRPAGQQGPVITKDDFALPPPPTRSRKIIQMKPREPEVPQQQTPNVSPAILAKTPNNGQSGGKRKSNAAGSTAAGRKIARKTAHSLIERRRRSKMNEEFGVLKDMIPACKGQEMHKLAILQASIEYLRYLEQCVNDLQKANNSPRPAPPPTRQPQLDEQDSDEEMSEADNNDDGAPTPPTSAVEHSNARISLPSLSQITTQSTTSPSIFSTGAGRHYSISSASQASYSPYIHSNQTSPAFGPQLHHVSTAPGAFGLGSPAIKPVDSGYGLRQIAEGAHELAEKRQQGRKSDHELDQEATAALLMLNHDRRNWRQNSSNGSSGNEGDNGRGMSVRDLLTG